MTPDQTTLSEAEFAELCKGPQFKSFKVSSLDLAKLMWVDGLSQGEAGKQLGLSRQSASALAKRLEAAKASAPEGWVLLNVYVPPELEREVHERLDQIRATQK
jgi:hypothetical protein